jgi:hypothetical protein
MSTQEIARDEWDAFFDSFSLQHRGWLVTVEVSGPDIGAQIEARELPLQGITAELKGGGEERVVILVGDTPEQHVAHTIFAPTRLMVKRTEEGADEAIEIESADMKALVRFRSAVPPEMVDGIS